MRLTDEQLGAELFALRETPGQDFAARLDGRAAAGFPATRKAGTASRELSWRRLGLVLAPLAAVAVLVVVIANSNRGTGGTNAGGEFLSAPATKSAPPSAAAGQATGGSIATQSLRGTALPPTTPAPPNPSGPRNGQPQVQELSASLGLSTDPGDLQDAADGVVQVANRYDGFVDASSVHAASSNGHASFSLRIPAVHLRDALTDLSALGRVTSRDEGSTNVTGAYTDAGRIYRDAQAKVDSLLNQLRSASSPAEAAAIRQQLVVAREQLAASRTALRGIKQRVAYAPVSVEITTVAGGGAWSIGDALHDAGKVLVAIAGALLIALAVLVPIGALLALGWLGTRELHRRRREAALDR